ncbi:MAG TPA: hypothetical protein VF234_00045, partial [Limnochordia bacterium]
VMGTTLVHRQDETALGFHVSNVVTPGTEEATILFGVDGEWSRLSLVSEYRVGGAALVQERGDEIARSVSLYGSGALGRVFGKVEASYADPGTTWFSWERPIGPQFVSLEGGYRLEAGVIAKLNDTLKWDQTLSWEGPGSSGGSALVATAGPRIKVGPGELAALAGLVIGSDSMEPLTQIEYALQPGRLGAAWSARLAAGLLRGETTFVEGAYTWEGRRFRLGAGLRYEYGEGSDPDPAVLISFQPQY